MHLKNFPKRLDSKTSCLRITVPENLDLALEGLIRKVLREQPKTDHIHSFAADYFETLLKIRDKAGAKYSSAQLCPFHDDEDAHEMIKLASTFSKPLKKKGEEPLPSSGKVLESGSGTRSRVGSGGAGKERTKAKESLKKEGKQKGSSKQVTPDLIKKLVGEGEGENDEGESMTGDPIKELVEKELKMESLGRKSEADSKETPKASAREEARRGQPEEGADIGDGNRERGGEREENTEDLLNGSNGRSEAGEEANEEAGAAEPRVDAEGTTDAKEAGLVSGHEIPVKVSEPEGEADAKKDGSKPSADETETKKMEPKMPTEAEVVNAQIVEDKLPTAKKDRDSETTEEIKASDVLPDEMDVEMRNDESGRETAPKEAEGEEKEPEKSLREQMPGNDGTAPQLEADTQLLKEKSDSESEYSAAECLVAEVQEKSDVKTEIESIGGEDVTTEAGKADAVVAGRVTATPPLLKDAEEHKVNAENGDRQQEQPEPGTDSESERKKPESEEKPPTEEERLEGSSGENERAEPEKAEKSKSEPTSDGGVASKENVIAASVEDVAPAAEEVPGEQKKGGAMKTEADSKASISDQPKEHETGEGSKGDATAKQKPLEEQKEETAVEEEAGEDEGSKSGAEAQPLSRGGDDLERVVAEAASPSANGTAEAEKAEEAVDVKGAELDLKESQNEERGDELCGVVDIREVPPKGPEKEDAKEPEEELCTVVDSQHMIRIEEPEEANDSKGVPRPPEEVQIKTIQTHYYDALQVPETVTKELRVHNVSDVLSVAPLSADPVKAVSNGNVEMDDVNTDQAAGFSDSAQTDGSSSAEISAESGPQQKADSAVGPQPSERPGDVPLLVEVPNHEELGSDTRRSETDDLLDLMTPTSGYSVSVSELSWRTVSGMFLESERRHSCRLWDELGCGTPKSGEMIKGAEEGPESGERRPEIEEVFHERVVPTLVGAVPLPPRDAEETDKEKSAGIPENAQEVREREPGGEPLGGSSDDKSFDSDTPFISVEVKTVIETQVLDDEDEGERRPRLELKVEATVEVEDAEEETRKGSEGLPEGEEKEMSDGEQKGGEGGPKGAEGSAGGGDGSGERTAGREGSSGESDSTISSAATEIKRSDPGKRGLGREGSLLLSQSLDLGGRNPLLRTRSLSTFRHGVTDFEVWSAIEKELEEAATKIQARFRRYKARKKLQRGNAVQMTTEESSASNTPADERQQSTGEFHDSIVLSDHPR